MKAPSTLQRVLIVLVSTLLLAASGTVAWATANDYGRRGFVPAGVEVLGTDLGGMSEAEARSAIEDAIAAPLLRPVKVRADGKEFTFDPRSAVAIDVDAMIAQAYAPRAGGAFFRRVGYDLGRFSAGSRIEPVFAVDPTVLSRWLSETASSIDSAPVDAKLTVANSRVQISKSAEGRKTDLEKATAMLEQAFSSEAALAEGERVVEIPVATVKPKKTEKDFGKTIVVDLSERRIRLFNGDKIEKEYPCAVGTPQFPTPKGEWEITLKRFRPTWVNPGSAWAVDMPPSIPPGPGNPLGTRAINLSAPGIRFHGTDNIGSVGTAASHGCMRMYRRDIEDLYERVNVGMKVYIVR